MKNQETITDFKHAYDALVAVRDLPEKTEFEIQDLILTKEHFLRLDGIKLSETATRQVLNILKVKFDFPVIAYEIGDSDFNTILNLLKTARSEFPLVANISFTNTGKDVVPMVQHIYVNRNEQTVIPAENTYNAIAKALSETEIDYRFGSSNLEDEHNRMSFSFIADDEPIDVFGAGFDIWTVGYEVLFNENSFDIYPIYERLVCSNGMKSVTKSKNINISKNKFNDEQIYKIIHRTLKSTDKISKDLFEHVNELKNNNLSLLELRNLKRPIEKLLMETGFKETVTDKTRKEIEDSFNFSKYDEFYHCDVGAKAWKWLSTANSGVNAYDMLNEITNISTHLINETSIPLDFSILAGNLFFKKEFDLSNVAGFAEIPEMKNKLME